MKWRHLRNSEVHGPVVDTIGKHAPDKPRLPPFIPGGSPENPMGVVAMTLSGGELAIHGTNEPSTLGHFVPYGCISISMRTPKTFIGGSELGRP